MNSLRNFSTGTVQQRDANFGYEKNAMSTGPVGCGNLFARIWHGEIAVVGSARLTAGSRGCGRARERRTRLGRRAPDITVLNID